MLPHSFLRGSTTTRGVWSAAMSSSRTRSTSATRCSCASTRACQQSAAKFFKDAFFYETESTAGEYYTGDRELSAVRTGTFGAKITVITVAGDKPVWGLFDKLQFNVRGDVLILGSLAADSSLENPAGIDKQFLYGNGLFDAVIMQL